MPDGRVNNGNKGHSTKAKGIDKRKNPYREAVQNAISGNDVESVFKMLRDKAINKLDTKAAQLLLEYTVGKPKDGISELANAFRTIDMSKWK